MADLARNTNLLYFLLTIARIPLSAYIRPVQLCLFICTGNYYRSRYAEAVFNYEAERRSLPWRAISRGLAIHLVHGDLSSHARRALEEKQIPLTHTTPTRTALTLQDLVSARKAIGLQHHEHYPLMQTHFPQWADQIDYWDVADADFLSPMLALRRIDQRVLELLDEVSTTTELKQ